MQRTMTRGWQRLLAKGCFLGLAASAIQPLFASSSTTNGNQLQAPVSEVLLTITGAITNKNTENAAQLDLDLIRTLPVHNLRTSTAVTDGVKLFEGVLMRDLLALVGAQGTVVEALALNNYSVEIPVSDFHQYDVLLATHMNGERLLPSGKGPFWIVYPRNDARQLQDIRYDYRWVWQLHRLSVK
jgi:hypothetical protein